MAWQSSARRSQLPPDWNKRRLEVQRRAKGMCEAEVHVPECNGIGTDCDHVGDRNNHELDNLQWLSRPCHKAKTQAESSRSRGLGGKRTPRAHPGDVTD